jgi:SHS2 domain-containing protein
MTVRFEILEHAADVGFRAGGRSLEELFENAALAVESIAMDIAAVEPRTEYLLAADGEDRESLLINWLSEIVYYIDGPRVAMCRFEISELSATSVRGKGWGEPRDPIRHPVRIVVKAVTYHQLRVQEEDGRWVAQVFLDI